MRAIQISQGVSAPREKWISLGTPDVRTAKAKLPEARAEQHRKWSLIREAARPAQSIPSTLDMVDAVLNYVHDGFVETQRQKIRILLEAGLDPSNEARHRRNKIVQAELLPNSTDLADMERVAEALCRERGWILHPRTGLRGERWNELVALATKAIQLARGQIVETLEGRAVTNHREFVQEHLGGRRTPKAKAGETVMELFDHYESDRRRDGKSSDTLGNERKVIGHFASFVGRERSILDVGRPDIREFRRVLSRVPHRWVTKPELKGMTIKEAAHHWERSGGQGRSLRTVAKELSAVSAFFTWLIANAYVDDENPTTGFFPRIDKSKTKYPPYSLDQLKAVFSSPLFRSSENLKPHLPGKDRVRDWRYWLPLCALYSGARTSELAQLIIADVRKEDEIWVFDFNEDEGGAVKSLKSRASRRLVPVHRALVALGFLDHVSGMTAAGHVQLFPQIKPGPRGDMGYTPSKFWQRYLMRVGMKEKGLALHSFRHTFRDECRRQSVSPIIVQALLGHADNSITGHYGAEQEGTLAKRREAIDALDYGKLHCDTDIYGANEGAPLAE